MAKILKLADLKEKTIDIELPGWDIDEILPVKLQRINIINLASQGKIPNPLMPSVMQIFQHGNLEMGEGNEAEKLKKFKELTDLFAEVSFVEPTFKEITDLVDLTDDQRTIIYNFAVGGVLALEPFRKESTDNGPNKSSK